MGFFSYTCAKTNLPILASTSWPEKYSRVVVLDEDGNKYSGSYDGYGNITAQSGSEIELDDSSILAGRTKLILQSFYESETFDGLGKSGYDPGQGHFHDEEKIEVWYSKRGFPSHREFVEAYRAS